ncbi:MAG TPA: HAMP domain-containing sensor histidine kinase [Rhizomicrobium sp.]
MTKSFPSAEDRSDRILVEKLRLLYRGSFAVPFNLAIACVVAFLLWDSFPRPVLVVWLVATALVAGLRLLLHRKFLQAVARGMCSVCWAARFCIGAFASGLIWGVLALGLPVWGGPNEYVLLTLIGAGMSAGALTAIVAYLPAYLVYATSFVLPLVAALLLHPDQHIAATGWLMLLYLLVIGFAARNLSRSVNRTIELQVDNEVLHNSLVQVRIERDDAQTEKWSTLAQLSHELRTPLNAILGFSEAMREEIFGPLGDKRYKDYVAHVHNSGSHLLTLILEILQLSQGEAGKMVLNEGTVDLAAAVAKCVEDLMPAARKAELTLKSFVPPDLPLIRADDAKTRQMLSYLADNAIKFTPPHGAVLIEAAQAADGGIDLIVRDTGIGMKAEDIPLALQPFGRIATPLKQATGGMGLGLSICMRMAELHGAELTLNSEPGKGTECRISFPASRRIGPPAAQAGKSAVAA